jgi:hypothetical protein
MAAWQLSVLLIPREWARRQPVDLKEFLTEDGWGFGDIWGKSVSISDCSAIIGEHLKSSSTSDGDFRYWGEETSNDMSVHIEGEYVREICARVDMRIARQEILDAIGDIAERLDCIIFVMEHGQLVEPRSDQLEHYAASSRASRSYEAKVARKSR